MKIKELFLDERPRERLFRNGADSLSNAELLAILLRTGTRKMNAVELARNLLEDSEGKVADIASMSIDRLLKLNGVGPAKAAALAASFELGRRCAMECFSTKSKSITSPNTVYRLMIPYMKTLDHEECWVLYLNRSNRLIGKERMSSGGLESTIIDCKSIVRKALEKKASGLILIHNHPSGSPMPGVADIKQTQILKNALKTCDISLIDHVVIADSSYYSFADEEVTETGLPEKHHR
jgi:DNA repair protein RadC